MNRILYPFKIFDLLYYAGYQTTRRSDKSSDSLIMGSPLLCLFLFVLIIVSHVFDIDFRTDWSVFSILILSLLWIAITDCIRQFQIYRHYEIIKKYHFIQKQWQYWIIIALYNIFFVGLLMLSVIIYHST